MATIHECVESGYKYCDALQAAFDEGDKKQFEYWLELQRNWLLVGLREVYAYEDDDELAELDQPTVVRLLAESNDRRHADVKQKK